MKSIKKWENVKKYKPTDKKYTMQVDNLGTYVNLHDYEELLYELKGERFRLHRAAYFIKNMKKMIVQNKDAVIKMLDNNIFNRRK